MAEKYDNLAVRLRYRDVIKNKQYSWALYSIANEIIPYRIMRRFAKTIKLPKQKELSTILEGISLGVKESNPQD